MRIRMAAGVGLDISFDRSKLHATVGIAGAFDAPVEWYSFINELDDAPHPCDQIVSELSGVLGAAVPSDPTPLYDFSGVTASVEAVA